MTAPSSTTGRSARRASWSASWHRRCGVWWTLLVARGEFEQALPRAQRWLQLDPLHEPAHRELIRLYAWSGDRAAALEQYRTCVRTLSQELGVAPLEETATLYEEVNEGSLAPPRGEGPRRRAPTRQGRGATRAPARRTGG